jgi:uncharacterized repeat protein (TIGR01451 family)
MIRRFLVPLVALFFASSMASAAQGVASDGAAQPIALHGDVKLVRTVTENGQEKQLLVEPKSVVPGDRLLFSTSYSNVGAQPINNVVVTNPLPSAVEISAQSAAELTVSVDGGKHWGRIAGLTVADGKGGQRPAQAADVTHIRWIIPVVAPGASGTVSYNGIVR